MFASSIQLLFRNSDIAIGSCCLNIGFCWIHGSFMALSTHKFIELDYGKNYRKALYLMGKSMVSCRFSLKPIHRYWPFKAHGLKPPPRRWLSHLQRYLRRWFLLGYGALRFCVAGSLRWIARIKENHIPTHPNTLPIDPEEHSLQIHLL